MCRPHETLKDTSGVQLDPADDSVVIAQDGQEFALCVGVAPGSNVTLPETFYLNWRDKRRRVFFLLSSKKASRCRQHDCSWFSFFRAWTCHK